MPLPCHQAAVESTHRHWFQGLFEALSRVIYRCRLTPNKGDTRRICVPVTKNCHQRSNPCVPSGNNYVRPFKSQKLGESPRVSILCGVVSVAEPYHLEAINPSLIPSPAVIVDRTCLNYSKPKVLAISQCLHASEMIGPHRLPMPKNFQFWIGPRH